MSELRCPLLGPKLANFWHKCQKCRFTLLPHDWEDWSPVSGTRVLLADGTCRWSSHNPNELTISEARKRLAERQEADSTTEGEACEEDDG